MKTISRYEIVEELGRGAMGKVLLAWDPVIERHVALKLFDRTQVPAAEADEAALRFKREAIAAGRLTHPNIVAVYEYGEQGETSYIAMEYARGETLRKRMTHGTPWAAEAVLPVARQLFAAMIYAHEQGIAHRDLKPGNIVLSAHPSEPGREQAKILDFGIARVRAAQDLTEAGISLGTPGYMPPEQCHGAPTDERADVYALGVMLFELLAGRRPFEGTVAEIFSQTLNADAPRLSQLRSGLPDALDDALARALARAAGDRFPTMRAFRDAFTLALSESITPALLPVPALLARAATPRAFPALRVVSSTPQPVTPAMPAAPAGGWATATGTLKLQAIAQTLGTPATADPAGARPKVLFLDDEERILGALQTLFRSTYEVLTATDGEAALELVRRHRPSVIVSDQRMPGMPGVEFLRRAREIAPAAVRILLTGYSDLAAIVGSVNDGEVYRFISKPWSNQDIRQTLAEAVAIAESSSAALSAPAPVLAPATPVHRAGEGLLVVQKGRELFDLLNDGFGRTLPVCHAQSVDDALSTLEDQEIAALVCDLDSVEGAGVMFKLLKAAHPSIQGIALTGASDSDMVIGLINEAQVHRFVGRPLRLTVLDRHVKSALDRYRAVRAQPVLAERQRVIVGSETAQSPWGQAIWKRVGHFLGGRAA
ncbi:MAG: protein kinase [Betaproteobacteria bacterium]|nr:protein kinase [Betaproteobacteria bacterium]